MRPLVGLLRWRALAGRLWLVAVASLVLWTMSVPARAATLSSAHSGRIVVSLAGGAPGPVVLTPVQGAWVGEFVVSNTGSDALTVSRIGIRGEEDDIRSPSGLSVRFADGAATTANIAPGASKNVVVSFVPERTPRIFQALGHVVITSSDEQAGEVAMGFRAQLSTGLGWIGEHALSLLVLWPFAIVLMVVAARLAGQRDSTMVRRAALVGSFTELLLALWVYRHFVPDFGRINGNEGFQLVERCVWVRSLGAEWYLGVDGTNVMLVVSAALVVLIAVLVAEENRRSDEYYASLALLSSGVAASLVALDLILLFAALSTVLLALVMLVGAWGGLHSGRAAAKLASTGAIGLAAMVVAFVALSSASGRSYLVDGSTIAHTMSIPELARTSFASHGPILGVPFVEITWALLFVAVAAITPLVPLHGWLPDALAEGGAGVGIVMGGIVVALGPYLLMRVGLGALPEGARWASSSIAAIGALGAAWGALCALVQRDLRRFTAYGIVANAGVCLCGIGTLTPQGLAGAMMALFAHGLASVMVLAAARAIERRVHTCDAVRLGGLAAEAPILAALLLVALGVSLGVPGLAGAWGVLLTLAGGVARHPVVGMLLAVALVVSAAAHARMARLLLFERVDTAWRTSRYLEAFGGRLPDATPPEMVALVPVAALALILGVWPVPALSPMDFAAHDLSAPFEDSR